MGADKALVSYDKQQQYRSVVMQQGRVTLEADWNEACQISGEVLREDVLDIVGPAGTPNDGYRLSVAPEDAARFDFHVGPGTMYVGGVRVEIVRSTAGAGGPEGATYFQQPDLLSPLPPNPSPPVHEFVYLH